MQRSLYTAVSGVKGHQTYLDVTGHNVANVNTVGYKRDVMQFSDTISQLIRNESAPVSPPGGVNPAQVGLGVRVGSISPSFAQGAFQATAIPTDMAIQGEGFFIVNNMGRQLYTRAGNFAIDRDGNLVTQGEGSLVQGYRFNGTEMGNTLSDIVIPVGHEIPQRATTIAAFRSNLSSNAPAGTQHESTVTIHDSLGNPHIMVVMFKKQNEGNSWEWEAYFRNPDGSRADDFGAANGEVIFGPDGLLDPPNQNGTINADFTSVDAGASSITLDFLGSEFAEMFGLPDRGSIGGLTSFGTPSTASALGQDGYARGVLRDWSVGMDGVITGEYTNGILSPIAQVALARVINPQGMSQVGKTSFAATPNAGDVRIMTPGENGAGLIIGRTIEMSNVDLSEEFVNLIRSQRGLQANTRAITTSDRILETTINVKR